MLSWPLPIFKSLGKKRATDAHPIEIVSWREILEPTGKPRNHNPRSVKVHRDVRQLDSRLSLHDILYKAHVCLYSSSFHNLQGRVL